MLTLGTSMLTPTTTTTRAAAPSMGPYWMRSPFWNPDGVELPFCVPEYLKASPAYLVKSTLPGDAGFDPLCLTALAKPKSIDDVLILSATDRQRKLTALSEEEQQACLDWMREAELKHGRIAMLAAAGWPMAELWNGGLAQGVTKGRVPSVFNGGFFDGLPLFFFVGALAGAAIVERNTLPFKSSFPGDLGFDPLGYYKQEGTYKQKELRLQEIKNGRLAMLAITGFAVQEFLWGSPVVAQTPFFFGR